MNDLKIEEIEAVNGGISMLVIPYGALLAAAEAARNLQG